MTEIQFTSESAGSRFTLILNEAIRDPNISWRAKGILAGCLSHGQNFRFTKQWIIEHGTEGRDAVIAALKELRSAGYLKNVKIRDESNRITGEFYRFTDVQEKPVDADPPGELVSRTPGFQRPEKPDAGISVRHRRPIERKPIQEPPCIPPSQPRRLTGSRRLELPEWLEPYRLHLEQWQQNRKKAHPKATPGITDSTLKGLLYAKECGILREYCEYASEKNWQSLGFIGHREAIDKLAKEFGKEQPANKSTAKIIYTIT